MNREHIIFDLEDVIDFPMLKKLLQQIDNVSGMRTYVSNFKGVLYEELQPNCNLGPCIDIQKKGLSYCCDKSNALAGFEAARLEKPIIYRCPFGAAEVVSPIVVGGQYFGSILTGQSLLPEEDMKCLHQFASIEHELTREQEDAIRKLPAKLIPNTMERLLVVSNIIFIFTNYIAELGYSHIMQRKIDEYEIDLIKEREHSADLERSLSDSRLHNIEAQMRPHFLFNTLNAINQLAIIEDAKDTSAMVCALSRILRRSLQKNSMRVDTIHEELEQIRSFFEIEHYLLQNRLNMEFDIDESCKNASIPPFTLEPLVENAIKHGIEQSLEGGVVRISIKRTTEIMITIQDNGVGIDRETLYNIQKIEVTEGEKEVEGHLGIRNAVQILRHTFGDDFSWTIDSTKGKGTTFKIQIPYIYNPHIEESPYTLLQ